MLDKVDKIVKMVKKHRYDPRVRYIAAMILNRYKVPERDYIKEIYTLYSWVKRNIRYVGDAIGRDKFQTPIETMKFRAGDCEDQVILLASMLESIGYKTKIVILGPTMKKNKIYHVVMQVGYPYRHPKKWINIDPSYHLFNYNFSRTPIKIVEV